MPSSTVENYVKQIYLEQQRAPGDRVSTGRLAAAMRVAPGTVTTMLKALADADLVRYESRAGATLTSAGEQLALHVLRRHRLVELFLVRVLGLDWSEVHPEAEELEHVISDKVLERIDALLGRPSADPHGDPIPTAKGTLPADARDTLANCALGQPVRITRVMDQDPAFLQFAHRCGLVPDATVTVQSRDPHADAALIHRPAHQPLTLGNSAAAKIVVQCNR